MPEMICDVVDAYITCLGYAMEELGYEDHIRTIHSNFYNGAAIVPGCGPSYLENTKPRNANPN